jgi:hypothetical protein
MSNNNVDAKNIEAAKEYVDKQLDTMKRYGSAPDDVSEEEYRSLVFEIAEAINLK